MSNETRVEPMVSVVMPFFNTGRFIQEAIESVFAQSYGHWELLLVDDGSTDGSTELAQRYVVSYPEKVRYLNHPGHQNRKASATRNLGIRNAIGTYIALLDSDDVWLSEKLARQVAILEQHPGVAMVYGPSLKWYGWSGKPDDIRRDTMYVLGVDTDRVVEPPAMLVLSLRDRAIVPSQSNILFRREMIERIGGFEESFTGPFEDHAFMAKVHLRESVFAASECWDKYRRHPDSSVEISRREGKADAARLFFLRWLEGYLAGQGMRGTEVWKALRTALWPYEHPGLHILGERVRRILSRAARRRPQGMVNR